MDFSLDKVNDKKKTLQKHDEEIEKANKMLAEAFRVMGAEKDGVVRVYKEAEGRLALLREEYEILKEEKEKVVRRDQALASRHRGFVEDMQRLEVEKKSLLTEGEEVEWKSCLLSNNF